ncbi:SPOR domain-containing protein [bacterium]|nr:SPOR domain-containing protein [bacterium]
MKFPTKGLLSETPFIELLKDAAESGLTGMIRLENAPTIKVTYFQKGTISFAASNDKADRLTEVLKRAGKLTPEQVQDAQARLKPNVSLGKTLLELGYISAKDLLWGAHAQVDGIIHELLFWNQGKYQVHESELPQEMIHLNLPVASMVYKGIIKTQNREWILQHIGSPEAVYAVASDFEEQNRTLNLPVTEVVSMLNGQISLHQVAETSNLDTFEICKTVVALEYLDLVRPIMDEPLELTSPAPVGEAPVQVPVEPPAPDSAAQENREDVSPASDVRVESPEPAAEISKPEPAKTETIPPVKEEEEKIPEPEPPAELSSEVQSVFQPILEEPALEGDVPMLSMGQPASPGIRWKRLATILLVATAAALAVFYYVQRNAQSVTSSASPVVRHNPVNSPEPGLAEPPGIPEMPPEGPLRLLRNGRVADAANSWNSTLANAAHGYTIQLVIACQAKTVVDTHRMLNYSNEIIVLPVNYKNQICHRVLFGQFSSKSEARDAVKTLPNIFIEQSSPASVVEISKVIF